jgi:hypothetical protein
MPHLLALRDGMEEEILKGRTTLVAPLVVRGSM